MLVHTRTQTNGDMDMKPTNHFSPIGLIEEEGELSDQEASESTQERGQLSEEQNCQETVGGV